MALPTTRDELKEYCLRKLGKPVLQINVDDTQLEDRLDEALLKFHNEHQEGSLLTYLSHQITDTDKSNKYVEVANNVLSVSKVYDITPTISSNEFFGIQYQYMLSEAFQVSSTSMTDYYLNRRHMSLIQEMLNPESLVRFNRYNNRVHVDMNWSKLTTGDYLLLEVYAALDETTHTRAYGDEFLIKYTTALFKLQWGENLKKFEGMQLPGEVTFNGQKIWEEAKEELEKLDQDLFNKYSDPPIFFIG